MSVILGRCLIDDAIQPCELRIEAGRIAVIKAVPDRSGYPIISPGFIDWQVNGAADQLLNASPDIDSLQHINTCLQRLGTTAWLATVVTDSVEVMQQLAESVATFKTQAEGVIGVHFEGPHINGLKKGVHDAQFIRPPDEAENAIYERTDLGVKLLTLAPETLDPETMSQLTSRGCLLAIGHTAADYDQARQAIENGLVAATHLFNAMTGPASREPGVVAAVLESGLPYGLIMDTAHVHPAMVRLAYRLNPNMSLVSDAMPLLGSERAEFDWFGRRVTKQAGRLLDDKGRLAGACISQHEALKNALTYLELSLNEALHLVSRNPAKMLGLFPDYGCIAVGSRADLVLLNDQLDILKVYVAGEEINLT